MSRKPRLLSRSLTLVLGLAAVQAAAPQEAAPPVLGFTAESGTRQLALESQYDSSLDASNLEEWMRYITSKPIYTGSPHNKETADWMVEQFAAVLSASPACGNRVSFSGRIELPAGAAGLHNAHSAGEKLHAGG